MKDPQLILHNLNLAQILVREYASAYLAGIVIPKEMERKYIELLSALIESARREIRED